MLRQKLEKDQDILLQYPCLFITYHNMPSDATTQAADKVI